MSKLNIQFNDRQQKLLDDMATQLDTTKAGVLRIALSLLDVAIREHHNGNAIGVIKNGQVIKEIVGLY